MEKTMIKCLTILFMLLITSCVSTPVPEGQISVTVTGFRIDRSAPNPVAEINPVLYFGYKDVADGDMFSVIMTDIGAPVFQIGETWANVMKGIEESNLRVINQSSGTITARTTGKNSKIKVNIKYKFRRELLRKYTLSGFDESDGFL